MPKPDYSAYEGAAPYFNLVRVALGDLVEGEHFFDVVTDDVVYEVLYDLPGWPSVVRGRTNLMALFGGYVQAIALTVRRSADPSQGGWRPGRRHRIRGPRDHPRDRRELQQSLLFDHHD